MSSPSWEKSGNVTWVSCRSCKEWFPVDDQLVEQDQVELVCPHCAEEFSAVAAAEIRRP